MDKKMNKSPNTYYVGDEVFVRPSMAQWRGVIRAIEGEIIAVDVPGWGPLVRVPWNKASRITENV